MGRKEGAVLVHGLDLVCPFSGVTFRGKSYSKHILVTKVCKNGMSLTAWCGYHNVRIFIQDPILAEKLLEKKNGQEANRPRLAAE